MRGQRAGLVSRFVADAIDLGVTILAVLGVYLGAAATRFLLAPRRFTWPSPNRGLVIALAWTVLVLYLGIGWAATGRTVGKQVMGLRVVNHVGERMHLSAALLRALFCAALPIGLFWSAVSSENRSVQDLVLRTSVVYDWQVGIHPVESRSPGPDATT
jgi:uncharacterized RDD family membrane protein YckC